VYFILIVRANLGESTGGGVEDVLGRRGLQRGRGSPSKQGWRGQVKVDISRVEQFRGADSDVQASLCSYSKACCICGVEVSTLIGHGRLIAVTAGR
jgi:hypothetical protein